MLKRACALLVLVLSLAFALLCAAGIAGTWLTVAPLTADATRAFDRVDGALLDGNRSLDAVLAGLQDARTRLDSVKGPTTPAPDVNVVQQMIARSLADTLAPRSGAVRNTLVEVHDTSVVLQSLLGQVNDLPLGLSSSLDPEELKGIESHLTEVETRSRDLTTLLGTSAAGDAAAQAQARRTSDAVDRLIDVGLRYRSDLQRLQAKVTEFRTRTLFWLRWTPILLTVLLVWLILSQLSLFLHAWSWLRRP